MKFTFLENTKAGASVFVGVTNYGSRLQVNATRGRTSQNGVPTEFIRASVYKTDIVDVSSEECTTGCTPHGKFTRSTRVELSNVLEVDSATIVKDLHDIADFIEANPRILAGLKLQEASDYDLPVVGE